MAQVNIDVAKEASVQAVNTTVGTVNTNVQTVNTKVGTSSDTASSTPTTLFAGIKGLIAWFTGTWTAVRASYVDIINSNTATNNTASKTGTLSQKESYGISLLENATYGLSALKTAITGGGTPIVKSVQRGVLVGMPPGTGVDISISAINPSKSFVLLNSTFTFDTHMYYPILKSLTSNILSLENVSSANNTLMRVSWEVIEFY